MQNPDFPVDPALSLKEVRRVTGRGSTSIHADIKAGRLKTFLNGSRRYARASDVEAYLAARQAETANG
ncbi:MAG: helix-turn-helix transcriptional regulator [Labrys sp. (in: a-proteobacteria)]